MKSKSIDMINTIQNEPLFIQNKREMFGLALRSLRLLTRNNGLTCRHINLQSAVDNFKRFKNETFGSQPNNITYFPPNKPNDIPSLRLFKMQDGYLGQLTVPQTQLTAQSNFDTYVILDASSSMGENVNRIFKEILPNVFQKMKYDKRVIRTILFGNEIKVIDATYAQMHKMNVPCLGGTFMTPAVKKLASDFKYNEYQQTRILTLSDGELADQYDTCEEASLLANTIKDRFSINSQAVRFFTSTDEPDTRGLASMLQLNTVSQATLLNINSSERDDQIINKIYNLFIQDRFENAIQISSSNNVMLQTPWAKALNTCTITRTDNLVLFKDIPKNLIVAGKKIQIPIDLNEYLWPTLQKLIKQKCDDFIKQLKVLKVVSTKEAEIEVKNIMIYLSKLQPLIDHNLLGVNEKPILQIASSIANNNTISKKSAKEQAEFLQK